MGRDAAQGQMARDMTLFVDDDGRAYHVYSSEENSTLHISELTDDYLAHSGRYARFFVGGSWRPRRFSNAAALLPDDVGLHGLGPNAARSAVAESVWGPWRELGNPCEGPGAETTYDSQSTFVVAVAGTDRYIYMGDRWNPADAADGRYVWLPVRFEGEGFRVEWRDRWRWEE